MEVLRTQNTWDFVVTELGGGTGREEENVRKCLGSVLRAWVVVPLLMMRNEKGEADWVARDMNRGERRR